MGFVLPEAIKKPQNSELRLSTLSEEPDISLSSTFQVHLSTEKLGQSVDECGALLKKHEAFERLIVSQEEKVSSQPSVLSCLIE